MSDINEPINRWLENRNARQLWRAAVGEGIVAAYLIGTHVVIVHFYAHNDRDEGWELYLPACEQDDIDATLAAADELCGPVPE